MLTENFKCNLHIKASIISKLLLSKSFFWFAFKWLCSFNDHASVQLFILTTGWAHRRWVSSVFRVRYYGQNQFILKQSLVFSDFSQLFSDVNLISVYWQQILVSCQLLYIFWVYMLDTFGANISPFRNCHRA